MNTPRSWLYVPGDRPDRITKAQASAADAVIVDLEDAVAAEHKDSARANAIAARSAWVRINAADEGRADLDALAGGAPAGVVVAKCESREWLDEIAARLGEAVRIAALIESAAAVARLHELCSHPRVTCCHLGEVDLLADLGASAEVADEVLQPARLALVYASAAASLEPPVAGVHLAIDDLDSLATTSRRLAGYGFGGRAVIHPSHCAVVNEAFSAAPSEIAWAEAMLTAADGGARRAADGTMVDEAVLRRARRLLNRVR